ncbi:hypothetical protein ABK040_003146 [Willaertia magna]
MWDNNKTLKVHISLNDLLDNNNNSSDTTTTSPYSSISSRLCSRVSKEKTSKQTNYSILLENYKRKRKEKTISNISESENQSLNSVSIINENTPKKQIESASSPTLIIDNLNDEYIFNNILETNSCSAIDTSQLNHLNNVNKLNNCNLTNNNVNNNESILYKKHFQNEWESLINIDSEFTTLSNEINTQNSNNNNHNNSSNDNSLNISAFIEEKRQNLLQRELNSKERKKEFQSIMNSSPKYNKYFLHYYNNK